MLIFKLGNILQFVSISLAIGIAYIALDRFRYTNRIKAMLNAAIKAINEANNNHVGEESVVMTRRRKKEDTVVTLLRKKIQEVSTSKMFGVGDNTGCDVIAIYIFIFIEYLSLLGGSLYPETSYPKLYWMVLICSFIGAILPIIFIRLGTAKIKDCENSISQICECVAENNSKFTFSISVLKDQMDL